MTAAAAAAPAPELAVRLPRDAVAAAVGTALKGKDFTPADPAGWSTASCPCEETGVLCPLVMGSRCKGWPVPLPDAQGITSAELAAVLPAPDSAGTVLLGDAWDALGELAVTRLTGQHPYRLRQLAGHLGEALRDLAAVSRAQREAEQRRARSKGGSYHGIAGTMLMPSRGA